nr:hypothetical protein [Sinorhizobium meliloti]
MAEVFDHVKAFRDGQMVMCTLTVRHSRGQGLADLRKVVQAASRKARQGAPWARRKKQHGIFGVISAPEVTFSRSNGWHFHIHTALLLRGTGAEAQDLGEWFVRRYLEAIQAAGYSALLDGQDVSVIRSEEKLAEYISKGVGRTRDIAWEMAGQATKKARSNEGLHPFEILELASGDDGMKALWLEYAAAMKGVRSCVVSPAIAAALGIEADEDEERPGEEEPPEEQAAGYLRRDIWNTLMSRKRASTVLAALEDFGADRWADVERLALDLAGHAPETGEPARNSDACAIGMDGGRSGRRHQTTVELFRRRGRPHGDGSGARACRRFRPDVPPAAVAAGAGAGGGIVRQRPQPGPRGSA